MLKPILLGVEGEAKEIVLSHGAGLAYEPENKEAFLSAVEAISSDAQQYEVYQQGCAALAKAFDRKALAERMLDIMQEVKQ
jgi:glycosyltransferase involved in cell wall biosynthesis